MNYCIFNPSSLFFKWSCTDIPLYNVLYHTMPTVTPDAYHYALQHFSLLTQFKQQPFTCFTMCPRNSSQPSKASHFKHFTSPLILLTQCPAHKLDMLFWRYSYLLIYQFQFLVFIPNKKSTTSITWQHWTAIITLMKAALQTMHCDHVVHQSEHKYNRESH